MLFGTKLGQFAPSAGTFVGNALQEIGEGLSLSCKQTGFAQLFEVRGGQCNQAFGSGGGNG